MIIVKKISTTDDLQQAFRIRDTVFVKEQGCPADLEHEHDDTATHFLAIIGGLPAGAARWRRTAQGYKLERVAVLKAYRGKGIASALIEAVLADLPANAEMIYLHAQTGAATLYERHGFRPTGEPFAEAGIPHIRMIKQ